MEVLVKDRRGESKHSKDSYNQRPFSYSNFFQKLSTDQKKDRRGEENRFDESYRHETSSDENADNTMILLNRFNGDLPKKRNRVSNGIYSNALQQHSSESEYGKPNISKKPSLCKCGLCDAPDNQNNTATDVYPTTYQNVYKTSKKKAEINRQIDNVLDTEHQTQKHSYSPVKQHHRRNIFKSSPPKKDTKNHISQANDKCRITVNKHKEKTLLKPFPSKCHCVQWEEVCKYTRNKKDSFETHQEVSTENSVETIEEVPALVEPPPISRPVQEVSDFFTESVYY